MSELTVEYGGALAELSFEEKIEDEILSQTRTITAVLAENPAYVRFLSSPAVSRAERLSAADKAFAGVHPYLKNFIKMMTERGYADELVACFEEYERTYFKNKHISVAFVESAVALSDGQKKKLAESLEKKTGKKIELKCSVDTSVIGGIKVKLDGKLYDGSVRGRLDELRRTLADTNN